MIEFINAIGWFKFICLIIIGIVALAFTVRVLTKIIVKTFLEEKEKHHGKISK